MRTGPEQPRAPVTVVVATRNRRRSLLTTLGHLTALPDRPEIVVVDNASTDGTAAAAESAFSCVEVVRLSENRAAAARNVGVRAATTPYVAFSDDDSWWRAGSLTRAAGLLEAHPHVGLLAARILVGADRRLDPVCELMAESPIRAAVELPGPCVLGFVACGSVARRVAFQAVGGFSEALGFSGEERLLAVDLAAAGWYSAYSADVVAEHFPSAHRDVATRRLLTVRNELWFAWLRLGVRQAAARTTSVAFRALLDRNGRAGIASALRGARTIGRQRRPLPPAIQKASLLAEARR